MQFFSHDVIRPSQKEFVETIAKALKDKKHVLAHAPTGLGKTAAVLCPALEFALQRDLTVFFLTSRHTQHKIVLETAKKVMERNNVHFAVTSLIGKKWMCAQENVENMPSGDFAEYCKSLVENNQCEYYTNARGKNNLVAKRVLSELKAESPLATEKVMLKCIQDKVCPYELSLMLAEESKVIVADYYYLFHPHIREALFGKIKKKLEQAIIIVDEGHNLPSRVRELLTFHLSNKIMRLAIQEAKKHKLDDVLPSLVEIQEVLNKLSENLSYEKLVKQEQFSKPLESFKPYGEIVAELELAAEMVRAEQKTSHIAAVAKFLQEWQRQGDGFARIIGRKDMLITLSNRCLDPAILTKDVFDACYSAVVMSGTLSPTTMYADVLGLQDAVNKSFPSPFPENNRLALIVPRTTTKFTLRSERQYREIAAVCADIANKIPGNVMLFFPSYNVLGSVEPFFAELYEKTIFCEVPGLDKESKQDLLNKFSSCSRTGAALLGVASGSFGEGIDLPGILKGVIVVGLPLDKPDLETTELISYYDKKFGRGWEYGYTLPAMTKCIQNAGRCIRSEKDRGVIAFVDERYAWPRYKSCFPPEWKLNICRDYSDEIAQFFGKLA
ncbi:MAG TPA: ATP-dependent DNA helicase [Candidatus Nanoarchaeia archaeon]|nr:ATP-dependent DNA helicase [Candidatus Nanoarchaeia archaeon]